MKKFVMSATALLLLPATQAFAVTTVAGSKSVRPAYDICAKVDTSDKARCEARKKARAGITDRFEKAKKASSISELMDLNNVKAAALERKRIRESNDAAAATRKTYRQLKAVDDVNTSRLDYLNEFKLKQLECMLMKPGRPKNMCLDSIRAEVRKKMKDYTGTLYTN